MSPAFCLLEKKAMQLTVSLVEKNELKYSSVAEFHHHFLLDAKWENIYIVTGESFLLETAMSNNYDFFFLFAHKKT